MTYTFTFDLTPEQFLELSQWQATGLFAGAKQKLIDKGLEIAKVKRSGPNKVELDDKGVTLTNGQGVMTAQWSSLGVLSERPKVWSLFFKPNSGVLIPRAAVPEDQLEALTQQLRAWAGKRYKLVP